MNKAVVYARYSSDKQNEQSIEGQLAVCQDYAKRNDLDIIDYYIDRAISGKNDDREAFQQMLSDSAKKQFQYVIVYALDRFARNREDSVINNRTLKKNGVKRLSATENIGDTNESVLMESMLEGIAEYFILELSRKVKRGNVESLKKGQSLGGHGIYGYDVIDKKVHINIEESKIVYDIFLKYSKGSTLTEISDELNSKGYLNKRGNKFTLNNLYRMLENRKYIGEYIHYGITYTDIYPQIIPENLFNVVQALRDKIKPKNFVKQDRKPFYLTGKLFCENGHSFVGDSGTSKSGVTHYYYATKNKKCDIKPFKKEFLEHQITKAVIENIFNEEKLNKLSDDILNYFKKQEKKNDELASLNKHKKRLEREISNITKAIKRGIITDTLILELAEHEKQLSDVNISIAKEETKKPLLSKVALEYMFDFIRKNDSADDSQQYVLTNFVNRVIVGYNGVISIISNLDPDTKYEFNINDKSSDSYRLVMVTQVYPNIRIKNNMIILIIKVDFINYK